MMFLDSDDVLREQCLEERIRMMSEHASCNFIVRHVGIFHSVVGDSLQRWCTLDHKNDVVAFVQLQGWQTSSTFFRSAFVKQFRWDETACSWQDLEFHLRILLRNPVYYKDVHSTPDAYVHRGDVERISSGNRSKSRIECLFRLFLGLERDMSAAGFSNALPSMAGNWFRFLEIAAIELNRHQFKELKELWLQAMSFKTMRTREPLVYLNVQSFVSRGKANVLSGLLYRTARVVLPGNLTKKQER